MGKVATLEKAAGIGGLEVEKLISDLAAEIDIHYSRKENQLFPMLEAHHFTGPSQVMWSLHDDIRGMLKQAKDAFSSRNPYGICADLCRGAHEHKGKK